MTSRTSLLFLVRQPRPTVKMFLYVGSLKGVSLIGEENRSPSNYLIQETAEKIANRFLSTPIQSLRLQYVGTSRILNMARKKNPPDNRTCKQKRKTDEETDKIKR